MLSPLDNIVHKTCGEITPSLARGIGAEESLLTPSDARGRAVKGLKDFSETNSPILMKLYH